MAQDPSSSAAPTPRQTVKCPEHGEQQATFVCSHLVETLKDKQPRGFNTGNDPGNPYPDAWCDNCERLLVAGEDKDAFATRAKVTVMCAGHYTRALEYNLRAIEAKGAKPALANRSIYYILFLVIVAMIVGYVIL